LCGLALLANPTTASADAGGASFWLPGIFGSLAAVPGVPGWAYTTLYIHESEMAGASQNFVLGGRTVGSVVAGLNAHADVGVQGLTYVSPLPVLGGQASFSVLGAGGNIGVGIDATLTGPRGNSISGSATDNRDTFTTYSTRARSSGTRASTTRCSISPAISPAAPTIQRALPI
jgi:hypothetical protein